MKTEIFFNISDIPCSLNCMMLKMEKSSSPRLSIQMDRGMEL